MLIDLRHARNLASALAALGVVAGSPAMAAAPISADEAAVSTGSWFCGRYTEAAAGSSAPAPDVQSTVRAFARGYVYGVSEAVGRPFPETAANDRRIVELLGKGCREDTARAVRDSTLLTGRAMLDDARSLEGISAKDAGGSLACTRYLDAHGGKPASLSARHLEHARNWADGYINARFERAGQGLIPTAKNKTLMLERVSAACRERPSATIRDAARNVVEATLPSR